MSSLTLSSLRRKIKKDRERMKLRKISRSLIACLIVIAVLCSVVLAQFLYTLTISYHVGVATSGSIVALNQDGSVYSGVSFPLFTASDTFVNSTFYLKDTGNTEVSVSWNITTPSWKFSVSLDGYCYPDTGSASIFQVTMSYGNGTVWKPSEPGETSTILSLVPGANATVVLRLYCDRVDIPTPDAPFSVNFNAQ